MTHNYPYTIATNRVATLFDKIRSVGVPERVNQKWLAGVAGLGSSNDRRLLAVLRHLGFVGPDNAPTPLWKEYRGSNPRVVMANAVRKAYQELFDAYPDAHQRSNSDLTGFIRAHTDLGDEAVSKAVSTFKALVSLADFSHAYSNGSGTVEADDDAADSSPRNELNDSVVTGRFPGVTVNVNLQLTLPESTDPGVYDALFSSLKKHILE